MDLVLPYIGLIARFLLGLDVLALITLLGGAYREARSGGMVAQNGTAITPTGKDRIAKSRLQVCANTGGISGPSCRGSAAISWRALLASSENQVSQKRYDRRLARRWR